MSEIRISTQCTDKDPTNVIILIKGKNGGHVSDEYTQFCIKILAHIVVYTQGIAKKYLMYNECNGFWIN
jgi:hypothetical protein